MAPDRAGVQAPERSPASFDRDRASELARETVERLRSAKRPVILAGSALRAAGTYEAFLRLIDQLGVPVCTAWNAADLLWEDHPLFAGRPGSIGDRAGNFALQNADVAARSGLPAQHPAGRLRVRGVRARCVPHRRRHRRGGARKAHDHPRPRQSTQTSVSSSRSWLASWRPQMPAPHDDWMAWCRERRRDTRSCSRSTGPPRRRSIRTSSSSGSRTRLEEGDLVVCANGSACVIAIQAFAFKRGQRLLVNSGTAGMGYDLPAAVGAAFARRATCDEVPSDAAGGPGSAGRSASPATAASR